MIRQIIEIDEDKCNGCGLCISSCHEGAIELVDGKAKLIRDDYCDGLGNCLPVCPTGAIYFTKREAEAFDEVAVKANMETIPSGCPGTKMRTINHETITNKPTITTPATSQLNQWPVQIQLVPINAPYFENANLLIAADCCAYAYGNFHNEFMKNKITLIGCPKLDDVYYYEKLVEIFKHNNLKSVTITRMEVPCCGGIEQATIEALKDCGKMIPWQVVTISTDGQILD